ncbi:MAG: DUF2948 family protein [Pseudomonadota bacterium]
MAERKPLRLVAEDETDLKVISAALQDAVLKAENLKFDRKRRRFTLEVNRFQWEDAAGKRGPKLRVRSLLAFDGVLSVKTRAVSKADPDMVMSLLSLDFTPDQEPPGGTVSVLFAGDGELQLSVEALDVTLLDSTYEWATRHTPDHDKRRR